MVAACRIFVSFFAAVAIVLIAHHVFLFFFRSYLKRRAGRGNLFGDLYEKAAHEVVFDSVFISGEARLRQESGESTCTPVRRVADRGASHPYVGIPLAGQVRERRTAPVLTCLPFSPPRGVPARADQKSGK